MADALTAVLGVVLAVWIRFYSNWFPLVHEMPDSFEVYYFGAGISAIIVVLIFQGLELYKRPQTGAFSEKIPRIVRACGLAVLISLVLAFSIRTEPPISRLVAGISFFTVTGLMLIQRFALSRIERHYAKHQTRKHSVLILGLNANALKLRQEIEREPRLRANVLGYVSVSDSEAPEGIGAESILGALDELELIIKERGVDQIILTETMPSRDQMLELVLLCEREVVQFSMVPDMLSMLTSNVDIQTIGGIPLLGTAKWPLDFFWNRLLKRISDMAGSMLGLVMSAPVIAIAAIFIKRSSPGPVFYKQTRCGESGRHFTLYKLRTMRVDAEGGAAPGWSTENDPRRTAVGAFLRRWNIDELPQFLNVLRGDMSLVGPRPERPHFVEMFKADISRYMWRHVSKPGLTGWAQVNGLRGDTSIPDRISHDLYYLENWSLALDFKIISKTFLTKGDDYS